MTETPQNRPGYGPQQPGLASWSAAPMSAGAPDSSVGQGPSSQPHGVMPVLPGVAPSAPMAPAAPQQGMQPYSAPIPAYNPGPVPSYQQYARGPQPQAATPMYAAPMAHPGAGAASSVMVIHKQKSVGLALLLTFFFGPIGMLYSTVMGAVVMFFVNLLIIPITWGTGVLLTWPIGMVWAAMAASSNTTVVHQSTPHRYW